MATSEEIKARLDIVQYVGQYVRLQKAGRTFKAPCPFHQERTPSFVVDPDRQTWRCYGACAEGGDVLNFAMKQHGWTFREALTELGRMVGVEVSPSSPEKAAQQEASKRLIGLLTTAAEVYAEQLLAGESDGALAARTYALEARGFSAEVLARYQIGYAPAGWNFMTGHLRGLGYDDEALLAAGIANRSDSGSVYDRFRGRLMIPIRDGRGQVMGFGARALAPDDTPKYLNSPQSDVFDKSRLLFGLDAARRAIRDSGTAVIVEGYMDALQAHQAGYLNVVAQMGTALTASQLSLIVPRDASRVVLALDADEAGQNATRRSLDVARQALQADYSGRMQVDIAILQIPNGKDPDDYLRANPEGWPDLVAGATPLADFVIGMEAGDLDAATASIHERRRIALRVLPLLTASEDSLVNRMNAQKLALRLHIPEDDLIAWARDLQRSEAQEKARREARARQEPPPATVGASSAMPPSAAELPYMDDEGGAAPASADEPPLFASFVDGPPDERQPVAARLTTDATETELACLRLLMAQPELLFEINRRLRALSQAPDHEHGNPISFKPLTAGDFQVDDHRALMGLLEDALNQYRFDTRTYIQRRADGVSGALLQQIGVDAAGQVTQRVGTRFPADVGVVIRRRPSGGEVSPGDQLYALVLHLRDLQFQRELAELTFLVNDPAYMGDETIVSGITGRVLEVTRALGIIDEQLAELNA
jgi:DNA primase